MRCAARRRLFSNNPGAAILIVVFLVGAFFFALGTALVRRERSRVAAPQPEPAGAAVTFEDIDTLLARGDAASVRELERLRDSGADPAIRDAADAALMVIGSR